MHKAHHPLSFNLGVVVLVWDKTVKKYKKQLKNTKGV